MKPKLSVIVPTRERSDTLAHTLRTLTNQDYVDCEIIVSDNYSQDNTKQVVESFSDARIYYINTGKRVSMSENWEFALGHARGEFITYIGDDDGFIPGAITMAMTILEKYHMNALVWEKVEYCWPDYIDEGMRNWFSLKNKEYTLRLINGRKKLRQIIRFVDGYTKLPCLYNGIVRKSLIDELRMKSTNGVFFNSISPDVYSGIVLSQVVGNYLSTDFPFSVNGASRHSNGTSFMRQQTGVVKDSPNEKFFTENQCKYDQRLLMAPSILLVVIGEYMQAKQYLPGLNLPNPSWNLYVNSLIKSTKNSFLPDEVLQSAAHTVKQLSLKTKVPNQTRGKDITLQPSIGFVGNSFNFIAPQKMVENIYDACQLIAGMLPDINNIQLSSPINGLVRRVMNFLIIELKNLYRSV